MTMHEIATRLSDKKGNLWTRQYLANHMDAFTFLLEEGCFRTVEDVMRYIKTRDAMLMSEVSGG
jgi:hypothetical protein